MTTPQENKILAQQQLTNKLLGVFSFIGVPLLTWILVTLVEVKEFMATYKTKGEAIEFRLKNVEDKMSDHMATYYKMEANLPKRLKLERE